MKANLAKFLSPKIRLKPSSEKSRVPILELVRSWPFLLIHASSLGVLFFPFAWKWVVLCVAMYYLRMFGITAGFHRYFSHKTYKTGRVFQFVLAFIGGMSTQKGALWWAAHHRLHHRYSDHPSDVHSPIQDGFFWSHIGWILSRDTEVTHWEQIPDLQKFPELVFLNRYHLVPAVAFGFLTFLIWGWEGFFWGYCLSTTLLWHGTFTINSLSHVFGSQRYKTGDTSKNNFFLTLLTMGEGWHNNHHCYQASVKQGFYWWEFDPSYYVLKMLSLFGIVWDLRKPPLALLEAKRWDFARKNVVSPLNPTIQLERERPISRAAV